MKSDKKERKKMKGGAAGTTGEQPSTAQITNDPRFATMHYAPNFQRIPKDERKFKIDPRFKAVLTDDRFRAVDGQYDKYGRKMKKKQRVTDDLAAFYTVEGEKEEEGAGEEEEDARKKGKQDGGKQKQQEGKKSLASEVKDPRFQLQAKDEESSSSSSEDEEEEEEKKKEDSKEEEGSVKGTRAEMEYRLDYLNRLARGEVSDASGTSSSSDEGDSSASEVDDDDVEEEEDDDVIESRKLDDGRIPMGEATRRIAIMNCDWDHLKAVDLLGVLISFKPQSGKVLKVTVYFSDYGIEKIAEEAKYGPGFLREDKGKEEEPQEDEEEEEVDEEEDEEKGDEDFDQETLRAYEVQKLRYYFAIAECDSIGTAVAISDEVDGLEFEDSSVQLDARFVPDEINFEGRKMRDVAEALPSNYEPINFVTRALQQTRVECTWDQGDEERERKLTQFHKWHELDDDDLGAYIASSSSEDDEEEEEEEEQNGYHEEKKQGKKASSSKAEKRKKLRSMLLGGLVGDDEEDGGEEEGEEMEMTFTPGQLTKEKWAKKAAEEADKQAKENETPFEALLRKRKEKRKEKRATKKTWGREVEDEEDEGEEGGEQDDFFAEAAVGKKKKGKEGKKKKPGREEGEEDEKEEEAKQKRKEEELELLFAGEDREEQSRDFDMRALARQEKMKKKKLKGKRKRKEEVRGAEMPGQDFSVDTHDPRFAVLFDGDARYGIDRTSKEYKETEGMKVILSEQATRRKKQVINRPPSSSSSSSMQQQGEMVPKEKRAKREEAEPSIKVPQPNLSKLVQKFKKKSQ